MSYDSKCIRDIINDLNRSIFLPAIQREYVWNTTQVEKLFDSVMGDYPISSFLFWKIQEENKKDWTSYEFIRDFNKEKPHNDEADLSGVNKDIFLVLDGQQRLTSLFLGLKGSYRFFYYKWRKTNLYLNLLKKPLKNEDNPEDMVYQFQFRESSNTENTDTEFWYKVGRILDFIDPEDAKSDIKKEINHLLEEDKDNALKLVGRLHARIHIYPYINFYQEKSQDYDKVVEVFIRANTGGKQLEYSDILLSTATAKWKTLNAREEIQNFTDDINKIGPGYSFGKDFIMKGCLYLTENLPIAYKVKNFTKSNLEKIEDNWELIKKNIEDTIKLISKYGFVDKNILSAVALLPIAFYIQKINKKNYIKSSDVNDVKEQNNIQKWILLSLIKNAFGSASDNKLKNIREIFTTAETVKEFPFSKMFEELGIESTFSETEIKSILNIQYKTKYSYLVLSLLYPDRDWKDSKYHEDHIFPKTNFHKKKLKARGYDEEKIIYYQNNYNTILNLQLLTDSENLEKNSKDFDTWLTERDDNFKNRHIIPALKSYDFDQFKEFIEGRKILFKEKLSEITFL